VPYKEIGVKESNGDVRILTGSSYVAVLRMRSENVSKTVLNAVKLPKFEAVNGNRGNECDGGKRFTAPFKADVISRMHRELCGL